MRLIFITNITMPDTHATVHKHTTVNTLQIKCNGGVIVQHACLKCDRLLIRAPVRSDQKLLN